MHIRCLLAAAFLALAAIPTKAAEAVSLAPVVTNRTADLGADGILRLHWMGKKQLGIEAGAYSLMRIWTLDASVKVQNQSLDRLASAPWRLLLGPAQVTNIYTLALRPLLNDVVQEETYFEIRDRTNTSPDCAFAIRLDPRHSGQWETNLALAVQSLFGQWPTQQGGRGWILSRAGSPGRVELTRAGNWTLLGLSGGDNVLVQEWIGRINKTGTPVRTERPHLWLELDVNAARFAALSGNTAPALPRVSFTLTGDGADVVARAFLDFSSSIQPPTTAWTVPTDILSESVVEFSALRDVDNLLGLSPAAPALPGQVFSWAPTSMPGQWCWATPLPPGLPGGLVVTNLAGLAGALLASHAAGELAVMSNPDGAIWNGVPGAAPFFKIIQSGGRDWLMGGTLANADIVTNLPVALYPLPGVSELSARLQAMTNVFFYHWEATEPRVESAFLLAQAFRAAFRGTPIPMESRSVDWLKAITSRSGSCTTILRQTGPAQLTLERTSPTGFSALELAVLVDWLESPWFPLGLWSTSVAPAGQ
ncbi:MAG: hypothetical protein U1F98_10230 [Verrucomicrobiota bacterium]